VIIGSIVKSNSHIAYLCRVYGKLEAEIVPRPDDYGFGTFVTLIPVEDGPVQLVGVIRDTLVLNPEYGNVGPRLSSTEELEVFSPDYLNEKGVLVEILILGWVERGRIHHTIPGLAAQAGTRVELMPDADVLGFHRDPSGRFLAGYLPPLLSRNDPILASLLLALFERLEPGFPDQRRVIGVLKNNLAWKARVAPAG
jgi:hypothetical protein